MLPHRRGNGPPRKDNSTLCSLPSAAKPPWGWGAVLGGRLGGGSCLGPGSRKQPYRAGQVLGEAQPKGNPLFKGERASSHTLLPFLSLSHYNGLVS